MLKLFAVLFPYIQLSDTGSLKCMRGSPILLAVLLAACSVFSAVWKGAYTHSQIFEAVFCSDNRWRGICSQIPGIFHH